MIRKIIPILMVVLSGCVVTIPKKGVEDNAQPSNFEIIDKHYKSKEKVKDVFNAYEGDEFYTYFFHLSRGYLENQRESFEKGIPNKVRAGYFDLSEEFNKKKYNDSNYYFHSGLFTTTYRPKSLYGKDFNNYIAYCPIFFSWDKRGEIKDYIKNLLINEPYLEMSDVVNYMSAIQYSYCVSLNESYNNRVKILENDDTKNIADMYAMAFNRWKNRENFNITLLKSRKVIHNRDLKKEDSVNRWAGYLVLEDLSHIKDSYELWVRVNQDYHRLP